MDPAKMYNRTSYMIVYVFIGFLQLFEIMDSYGYTINAHIEVEHEDFNSNGWR